MIKLYWSPRSRSFSAIWLLEESGLPYERVLTDISTGAQKAPEYLAINPMGKVPGLKDGDAALGKFGRDLRLYRRPLSGNGCGCSNWCHRGRHSTPISTAAWGGRHFSVRRRSRRGEGPRHKICKTTPCTVAGLLESPR